MVASALAAMPAFPVVDLGKDDVSFGAVVKIFRVERFHSRM
jgi:hypothetical protein